MAESETSTPSAGSRRVWERLRRHVATLAPEVLQAAGAGWAKAALLEHASVASFARFTLELLAVGAPPELVEASHRAGLDEIEHARLSFRLASLFTGAPLGPGALSLNADAFTTFSLEESAVAAALDGCVNETLAAAEAMEAAARATEPAIQEVQRRIARDESRHAELAFTYVAWALRRGGDAVRLKVAAALRANLGALATAGPPTSGGVDLSALGLLPEQARHAVRTRTLSTVLQPAVDSLLEGA